MSFLGLLRHPRFSRLLAIRWTGQATDGVFQSALASFVLFSPERQANALSAAIGFAVVLLPYSMLVPLLEQFWIVFLASALYFLQTLLEVPTYYLLLSLFLVAPLVLHSPLLSLLPLESIV